MVSTRSRKKYGFDALLEYSKITARDEEANCKQVLGPVQTESRVHKAQASSASAVLNKTRGQKKALTTSGLREVKESSVVSITTVRSKRTNKAREADNAASVVQGRAVTATVRGQKRKLIDAFRRETDAARSMRIVIKTKDYRGPAFSLPEVGLKKKYLNPSAFFSNKYQWKVGHQPFIAWKGVQIAEYQNVFDALQEHCKKLDITLNITKNPLLAGHAYSGDKHKFHALIEPILSCATSNNNQKLGSNMLFKKLRYSNEQESKVSPNYHKLIDMKWEQLAEIIRPSGCQNSKANYIIALFRQIREENIKLNKLTASEAESIHNKAMNAADWSDGLLSLDFLAKLRMQEMFDKLVEYNGIACKTAACIMCFSFGFAIFAVDTHVYRQCQWLGWIPYGCTREDAFKFLTLVIQPELMRDLHQGLWHHGQLCFRCNEDTYHKIDDLLWKETVCPLEQFGINRFDNWEPGKKAMRDTNGVAVPKKRSVTEKAPTLDSMVTVPLKTKKDVADAKAAGHTILETLIDDAFGVNPELSNIKEKLKQSLHLTRADSIAFKAFQKTTMPAKQKVVKVKHTSKRTKTSRRKTIVSAEAVEDTTIIEEEEFGTKTQTIITEEDKGIDENENNNQS